MKKEELEKEVVKVFRKIHEMEANEPSVINRVSSLFNMEYLKLSKDYFVNKICLDAGCGLHVPATLRMLHMGAKKVYAIDLDKSILDLVQKFLMDIRQV